MQRPVDIYPVSPLDLRLLLSLEKMSVSLRPKTVAKYEKDGSSVRDHRVGHRIIRLSPSSTCSISHHMNTEAGLQRPPFLRNRLKTTSI